MNIQAKSLFKFLLILTVMLGAAPYTAHAAEIFSDSFESKDLSTTNAEGFKWTSGAWTSLVTETHEVWDNGSISIPIDQANSFPGTDWTAKTGDVSMRFRYAAGEAMSEQRFDLGTPMKDIWIKFWMKVPSNFSYGPIGSPNKFFSLWSDGYSYTGDGSTMWLGFLRLNTTDATIAFSYSDGGYKSSNAYQQFTPFITTSDRGRWMHMVMHFKAESSPGSSDGAIQTYRLWGDGESKYTKLHEAFNLPIKLPSDGQTNGFKAGYILGWANAAYAENTEWLMDDFVVSNTAPLELNASMPPKPPSGISIH